MNDVAALLERHIRSHDAHWHLGSFGVVAEFMRDEDEAAVFPGDRGTATSERPPGRCSVGFRSTAEPENARASLRRADRETPSSAYRGCSVRRRLCASCHGP